MTRRERDEVMRYVGQLEGLLACLIPIPGDETEADTEIILDRIRCIANDLECLAKGYDKFPPSNLTVFTSASQEGGDGDDV